MHINRFYIINPVRIATLRETDVRTKITVSNYFIHIKYVLMESASCVPLYKWAPWLLRVRKIDKR